jgi:glycosyltransferase involved in cell wall biosynthesis
VVGTSIGLEGLDVQPGLHVLMADEPRAFADATYRLLTNDTLAASLVTSGRQFVEERYSWAGIADSFARRVLDMAIGDLKSSRAD